MSRTASRLRGGSIWRSGVILMAGAALVSKLVGALQKIPLQNLAGDRVFGIYNAVYPFYQLIAILATAGLPTAVSIMIARKLKEDESLEGTRSTVIAASILLGATGVLACLLMWLSADLTASWIGDDSAALAIRVLSVALVFAPFAAVFRGYEQGKRRMGVSAASQLAEQCARVAMMVVVLYIGLNAGWSDSALAAGVMSGAGAGAIAALLLLLAGGRRDRPGRLDKGAGRAPIGRLRLMREMKELAVLAAPVALASIVVPIVGVVDAFMVPRLLGDTGMAESTAMSLFGIYSRGAPLVQLITMVAAAAAAAMVPGLVSAKADGNLAELQTRLSLQLRLAWMIGGAAAIGLLLLAEPLNTMLYKDAKGSLAFALVGCTALAGCVNAIVAPALQALGSARVPAALLLLAALLKGALNAALVPSLGIEGAALSGVIALSAAALLGAAALRRAAAGLRPPHAQVKRRASISPAAAGLVALAVMASAVLLTERVLGAALGYGLPQRSLAAALSLAGAAVGAIVFAVAALRAGAIDAREWRAIPGGDRLAARLRRMGLIPPLDEH
ncbi:oligosaccharide flippase family protein [Paenibacillus paeoniae]|uniref:Polysaccharide biosynthesis protein n=1 Tax=Paenibacillus paeoniae TaxID=2292705 RepID=A0A371NZY3_9BACL|nr:oligosaccharide flippase family protein [Paenibacillus paeoniae]REK69225.1 polysaccharide biosynthesis protein [Paenibacillus paeoniae]